MGPYLTTPKREKEVENGEGTKVRTNYKISKTLTYPILGEIWCLRDAGLEKHHGGFTHCSHEP